MNNTIQILGELTDFSGKPATFKADNHQFLGYFNGF